MSFPDRSHVIGCHTARILAVARVETLHLLCDRTTFSLIFVVPVIQIVLFGYAVNLDPRHVPLVIADHTGPKDQIHRVIDQTGYFMILADGLTPAAAERMVTEGKALIAIELPRHGPSDGDAPPENAQVIVDATDPAAIRPALAALENAYLRHAAQFYAIGPVPSVNIKWLYNSEGRTAWAIVPGLAGVIVMISMLMLGALTLVRERERGSWETLLATPVDAVDALAGKLSPYVILGTLQAGVVIWIAKLLFDLPVMGDLFALLIAMPLYSAAYLIPGFAISALAESQLQAIQSAVFFYLPSMLLSGFMFPFQGMPKWARAMGETLPLTHFVRATRGVLLKGAGASLVLSEMVPVALFALTATAIALAAYRRRIE